VENEARAAAAEEPFEAPWVTSRPTRVSEIARRLLRFPWLLAEHRDLVMTSVKRDLEARFRGTVLGWIWPLIHPLFLFAVYYFIFTKLLSFKIPDLPPGHEAAMGIYMFCGIMAWAAFAESLTRGAGVIVDNGNLIKKLAFPSEVLPLNVTLVGLVTLVFAVAVFLLATYTTPIWPGPDPALLVWLPVLLLLQGVFTYGLVLLLSTLQVFLRDTLQVVGVLTTVWMFLTPLFWVPELMPQETIAPYADMIRANPMYHLVQAWRGVLMGEIQIPAVGDRPAMVAVSPHQVAPSLFTFGLWALGSYVVGYAFFVLSQRRFADEV
jgi:ABC-type polysaccharide/polyol phosphate export permease